MLHQPYFPSLLILTSQLTGTRGQELFQIEPRKQQWAVDTTAQAQHPTDMSYEMVQAHPSGPAWDGKFVTFHPLRQIPGRGKSISSANSDQGSNTSSGVFGLTLEP